MGGFAAVLLGHSSTIVCVAELRINDIDFSTPFGFQLAAEDRSSYLAAACSMQGVRYHNPFPGNVDNPVAAQLYKAGSYAEALEVVQEFLNNYRGGTALKLVAPGVSGEPITQNNKSIVELFERPDFVSKYLVELFDLDDPELGDQHRDKLLRSYSSYSPLYLFKLMCLNVLRGLSFLPEEFLTLYSQHNDGEPLRISLEQLPIGVEGRYGSGKIGLSFGATGVTFVHEWLHMFHHLGSEIFKINDIYDDQELLDVLPSNYWSGLKPGMVVNALNDVYALTNTAELFAVTGTQLIIKPFDIMWHPFQRRVGLVILKRLEHFFPGTARILSNVPDLVGDSTYANLTTENFRGTGLMIAKQAYVNGKTIELASLAQLEKTQNKNLQPELDFRQLLGATLMKDLNEDDVLAEQFSQGSWGDYGEFDTDKQLLLLLTIEQVLAKDPDNKVILFVLDAFLIYKKLQNSKEELTKSEAKRFFLYCARMVYNQSGKSHLHNGGEFNTELFLYGETRLEHFTNETYSPLLKHFDGDRFTQDFWDSILKEINFGLDTPIVIDRVTSLSGTFSESMGKAVAKNVNARGVLDLEITQMSMARDPRLMLQRQRLIMVRSIFDALAKKELTQVSKTGRTQQIFAAFAEIAVEIQTPPLLFTTKPSIVLMSQTINVMNQFWSCLVELDETTRTKTLATLGLVEKDLTIIQQSILEFMQFEQAKPQQYRVIGGVYPDTLSESAVKIRTG